MAEVYFYEAFEEEAAALRACLPAELEAGFTAATVQEAGHAEPPAPVIGIRTQSALPVAWAPRLRAILSRSTGYDHLLAYRAATGNGDVRLGYLPLYCARAVAEQAMLLWMALLRRLPAQQAALPVFRRDGLTGGECRGRRLVVVGVGHIGREVVDIGRGLGMEVSGVDLVERYPDVNYAAPESALPEADVVVCAMNLTENNRCYFDERRLRSCRRGAIFVNIARGELTSAAVLLRLLEEGVLGGAGLDVYGDEGELAVALRAGGTEVRGGEAAAVLALARRHDAVLTPHNAFNTAESVRRKAEQSAEQLAVLRNTGRFQWEAPAPAAPRAGSRRRRRG